MNQLPPGRQLVEILFQMKSRKKYRLLRLIAIISILFFFLPIGVSGQENRNSTPRKTGDLLDYAKQKNRQWIEDKMRADSLADLLQFPKDYVEYGNRVVILQGLGPKNKPIYYATDNITAAHLISTDQLWTDDGGSPFLSGEGVDINIWDGGAILTNHQEFLDGSVSRVEMRNRNISVSNHSTHIAGTMAASGVVPAARGMANKVSIYGWDFNNDFAEMSVAAADGLVLSNHSYGSINGWDFNSTNEMWYWYGDTDISEEEDNEFGFYNQVSADLDFIAWSAPQYLIVKSAGNDRGESPESQPTQHLVWDGAWVSVTVSRDPDGGEDGYDCLTPMSVAKNILTVGAVDDLGSMTTFSAFGPTDDGRIKPDVVANGTTIYSTLGSSINSYGSYSGSSMAAASTTGSLALLFQLQQMLQPGVSVQSSTMKGLLIHTASETGPGPGPDYQHGWGLINMKAAADLLERNAGNGGLNIEEGILSEGEVKQIQVKSLSTSPFLKVTLCWTDPAGEPSTVSLNPRNKKLVNDLDLSVEQMATSQKHLPWILDVNNPGLPAAKGENHIDNVEQVVIPNPGSGDFTIRISHSGSLSGPSQAFSLIISEISTPENVPPPGNLRFNTFESSVILNWEAPEGALPLYYYIYRDGVFLAKSQNLSYSDLHLITDKEYSYYITALYERDGVIAESLPTKQLSTSPRSLRPLPFTIDFEAEPEEIQIKNDMDGWQWGDSESLSSYYLNFKSNETRFIATSSYLAGETSHVKDIATTMPLRLGDYSNVKLSFDYMLITGLYSSIDELHVVYKLQDEEDWHEWHKLPLGLKWTSVTLDLPGEAYKNGTQIGFYYDDFYQWGMGAGLDNISITGNQSLSSDLAITAMTEPVSSCLLSDSEEVSVTIKNTGITSILPGELIEIHMEVSDGTSITDRVNIADVFASGTSVSHTMSAIMNMSEIGSYVFNFTLAYANDNNLLNNNLETWVEAGGNPEPLILNTDFSFCINEDPVQILVSLVGGTLSGPGVTGMYFNPAVAGVGTHTLTYSFTDLSGCQGTVSKQVEVTPLPVAVILNKDLSFCVEAAAVQILVSPVGGTLSGPGVTGMYFNPAVAGVGTHMLTYSFTDANGCQGAVSKQVEVTPLPVAMILNTDLSFCVEAAAVQILVSPAGGTLTGPGVTGMYFYPAVAGIGTHTLTYSFTDANGCQGAVSKQVEVTPLPTPAILNTDLSFCVEGTQVQILVSPEGGTLTGPGVTGMYFYPAVAGIGTHTLTYSLTDPDGCQGSISKQVVVTPLPVVMILNTDLSFCIEAAAVQIQVSPVGGTLSGPGVTGMYFYPAVAGIGTHTITYNFTDLNGCKGTVSKQVVVTPLPVVMILNTDLSFCLEAVAMQIQVSPVGGTLSGPGVTGMYFDPAVAGIGTHTITYTFTDLNGCQGAISKQVEVTILPVAMILNSDLSFCVEAAAVQIQVSPAGGTLTGPGVTGMYFYPAVAGIGTHTLTYSFTDANGCQGAVSKQVEVTPLPTPAILNTDLSFCVEGTQVQILVSPEGGTLTGPGVTGMYFNPTVAGVGAHTITYSITDANGCKGTISKQVVVTPLPVVMILNTDLSFCVEAAAVQIQVSPVGGTLSGPGVTGMYFNPTVAGVGAHTITYSITDANGCKGTVSKQVVVTPLPVVMILNTDLSFCVEAVAMQIQVSPVGGTLSGPGVTGMYFDPAVAGVGTHTITYNFTDLNGCKGTVSKQVVVTPLPVAMILNSDLSFCAEAAAVQIQVSPAGGTLTGPGVTGMYFYPAVAGVGEHTITYTFSNESGCQATTSEQITVSPLPEASILNTDLIFCENDLPVLINGIPLGGILSGPGCSGIYFFPSMAGPGLHTITYSITTSVGCIGSSSKLVEVLAMPRPIFLNQRLLVCCEDDPTFEIKVNPEGGILSGPGVMANTFSPNDAGPGIHTLTYTYGDLYGCFNSIERIIRVKDIPDVDLGPDLQLTVEDSIELWPNTDAAAFQWYNGSKENHITLIGEEMGTGTHNVWLKVTSMDTCSNADTILVTVGQVNRIDSESNSDNFTLYPNPVDNGFYLKIDENESVEQISIFSQTGQIMMNHIPHTYPYFNVSHLHPGSYILKIHVKERAVFLKFIKL